MELQTVRLLLRCVEHSSIEHSAAAEREKELLQEIIDLSKDPDEKNLP